MGDLVVTCKWSYRERECESESDEMVDDEDSNDVLHSRLGLLDLEEALLLLGVDAGASASTAARAHAKPIGEGVRGRGMADLLDLKTWRAQRGWRSRGVLGRGEAGELGVDGALGGERRGRHPRADED